MISSICYISCYAYNERKYVLNQSINNIKREKTQPQKLKRYHDIHKKCTFLKELFELDGIVVRENVTAIST